jgi:hypothetical protein
MTPLSTTGIRRQNAFATAALSLGMVIALPVIACRKFLKSALLHWPQSCDTFNTATLDATHAAYNLGVLAINYQQHGLIRRGLGGTIVTVLGGSPLTNCVHPLIVFHLLSAIWLAIPLVLLLRRMLMENLRYGLLLAVVLLVSPQLFLGWGGDLGRTDMFTSGCIAWAVVALLKQHDVVAVGMILTGMLAHESAAIFGIPLLIAILRKPPITETSNRFRRVVITFVLGCGVIFVAQGMNTTVSSRKIVEAILDSQKPSLLRDVAAYMTAAGPRSIVTSWCQSLGRAATPLYIGCMVVIVLVYPWILSVRRKNLTGYVLATILPLLMISLIAIDYGRWLMFTTLNGWLFAVVSLYSADRRALGNLAVAGRLAVLAALVAMKPTTVFAPSIFVEQLATRLWGKNSTDLKSVDACDPDWRTFIDVRPNAAVVRDGLASTVE